MGEVVIAYEFQLVKHYDYKSDGSSPVGAGEIIVFKMEYNIIHTRQLNFLFSDWLFSKYAERMENVHCTPRTAS